MKREILLAHFRAYPLMLPADAVKLIYQSCFGGGHLIKDPAKTYAYLCAERASAVTVPGQPLCEDISGGMVRLYLTSPDALQLSSDIINRVFAASAARVLSRSPAGAKTEAEAALGLLSALASEGLTPFSREALDAYLTDYRAAGCPPVSHSEAYRAAYAPAYRVMEAVYPPLFPVIAQLDLLSASGIPEPVLPLSVLSDAERDALSSLYDHRVIRWDGVQYILTQERTSIV